MRRFHGIGHAALAGLLGLAVAAGATGCGSSEQEAQMQAAPEVTGLQSLAEAYRTISAATGQPPKSMQELEPAAAASPGGLGIDPANVVVYWGATLTDLAEEPGQVPSDKILAYEKKVPESGGYVLLLDRTIKQMTPAEFQAAPKAGETPE